MGKEIQKVNANRKRQCYSKEFKLTAVKLLQAGQKPGTLLAIGTIMVSVAIVLRE